MTGVQSAHIDLDWILDCLEVGAVTDKGSDSVDNFILLPCFYLNDKGIESAVEYLRARKELYRMVYYHKTTRAAEVMLRELLKRAANTFDRISKVNSKTLDDGDKRLLNDPVLRYLSSESPPISTYLELDDDVVSSTVGALAKSSDRDVSCLAKRLRARQLYKCVDVQIPEMSLRRQLNEGRERGDELCVGLNDCDLLFDYAWSEFYHGDVNEHGATDLLKRILVRRESDRPNDDPVDIVSKRKELESEAGVSFRRAYVPDRELQCKLQEFLGQPQ